MIWTFITKNGVRYPIESDAETLEDACVDFREFLKLKPDRFKEFWLTVDESRCYSEAESHSTK
ncbi:MAG: hypothetical protein KJO40_13425 [Deltaproteobacteria bacterium]|nr:hypothetical protein [Deltaproteobacteria bacterium]